VVDGSPELVTAGTVPEGCCSAGAGTQIADALLAGRKTADIESIPVGDDDLARWAGGDGVVDVVGEFTTMHACCESRVANVHRIADLIRGQYLLPGETFSINGFVGERTVEKGFVGAGVIEQGRFTEDVGGGISQFATTIFNAAFFAGLDFVEYQSHSIYISRYPYGREATLSFPKPDLVFTNTTEYPVLIWPTYTDTSITVTLYSTENVEVIETGQEQRPARSCTQVETYRTRNYSDGTSVDDSVIALYRPAEGLDCDGNPTPEQP
jgi:vancomycin resistance protein YoaR